jgi:hypothetical protein
MIASFKMSYYSSNFLAAYRKTATTLAQDSFSLSLCPNPERSKYEAEAPATTLQISSPSLSLALKLFLTKAHH